jgi:hypothetical protein
MGAIGRAEYCLSENTHATRQVTFDGTLAKPKTLCGFAL